VFASFGTDVTLVNRSPLPLPTEDEAVREAFAAQFGKRVDLRLGTRTTKVEQRDGMVRVWLESDKGAAEVSGEVLLVATGRHRNGDQLNLEATGLLADADGRIAVDEFQQTKVEGIWAFGDVSSPYMLKHVANNEARVVARNMLNPTAKIASNHHAVPHGVFTSPEIASVGLTEIQARESGEDVRVTVKPYSDTAYGWGLRDTTSFVKLIASSDGSELLGAHIIGPQATTLLQPLVQAMALNTHPGDVARRVYYPHPALTEAVEQALLDISS
jgi:mycothione reductase